MKKQSKTWFEAEGTVLGNLWGGGQGYYPARKYSNASLSKMKTEIKKDFNSGALDSGMGFESPVGAIMTITKHTIKYIDGEEYLNVKPMRMKLGKISQSKLNEAYGY